MASARWLNPKFDSRILAIGTTTGKATPLKRGYIVCDTDGGGAPGMSGKGVRFLYNPVSVTVSHTIDPNNLINSDTSQPAKNKGQPGNMVNIGAVSVDLLYDRTYELWDRKYKGTEQGKFGVYADVLGFYKMVGVVRSNKIKTPGPVTTGFSDWDQYARYPVNANGRYFLYFGDKMHWYGTLTDLEVTYSHWSQNMIPSRCSVSLSLSLQVNEVNSKPPNPVHGYGSGVAEGNLWDQFPGMNGGKPKPKPTPGVPDPHGLGK